MPLLKNGKYDVTALYGGSVGYKFNDLFRAEIESQYRRMIYKHKTKGTVLATTQVTKSALRSWDIFWNGYVDMKNSTIFTPYVTAGIGYSWLKSYGTSVTSGGTMFQPVGEKTSSNFAWNAGFGSKAKLTNAIDLDVAAKYVDLGKVKFGRYLAGAGPIGKGSRVSNIEVVVGLAYNF